MCKALYLILIDFVRTTLYIIKNAPERHIIQVRFLLYGIREEEYWHAKCKNGFTIYVPRN